MATGLNSKLGGSQDRPPPTGTTRTICGTTPYVRLEALLRILPFSPSTLWRLVRAGSFPRPVKLAPRITAWRLEAVEAWLAEREATSTRVWEGTLHCALDEGLRSLQSMQSPPTVQGARVVQGAADGRVSRRRNPQRASR